MMNSKKLFATYRQYITFAVFFTALLVIMYKIFKSNKRNWTKIFLFINSLIINDLKLRYVSTSDFSYNKKTKLFRGV